MRCIAGARCEGRAVVDDRDPVAAASTNDNERVPGGTASTQKTLLPASMEEKPKYVARIDNVYFMRRLGASLREPPSHVTTEALPEDIRLLLRRLERLEGRDMRRKPD